METIISKVNFNLIFQDVWLNAITYTANVFFWLQNKKTGVYPLNHHAISCVSAAADFNSQGNRDVNTQGMFSTIIMIISSTTLF